MFSNMIEGTLRGMSAATITEIFVWALGIIFLVSLFCKARNAWPAFTQYTPTLLTSVGILGTFTGIIVGLLDFDTAKIETSIGPLLEGLKTAFITSLLGMLLSIVFKVLVTAGLFNKPDEYGVTEEQVGALELYEVMKQQVEGIQQLKQSISESDESSLIGQLKLLRSDVNDNHKAGERQLSEAAKNQEERFLSFQDNLWNKLQEFADMLSKSATEQVIEALNQVIRDFNDNLTEQFGENFKQLNEAVHELVDWQENYREQLADMNHKYQLGVQAITQTEAAVSHIGEETKAIPESMAELKTVLEVNQHQIDELNRHLNAFKELRDRAVMAVPEIQDQIDLALEGAKSANDQLAKGILDNVEKIQKVVGDSADQYRETVDNTRAALTESAQATANATEEIKSQFSGALDDINNHMRNLIHELQEGGKKLKDNYQSAGEKLISSTEQIGRSLSNSMNTMRAGLESTIEQQAMEHRKRADQVFGGLEKAISNALVDTGEAVQKKVDMIDKTMGEEIEKVMQSMGNALASISGQFTNDYERLVRQMQSVVRSINS